MSNSDVLWLDAEREADEPTRRNAGLWARCFAEAEGNEGKAKALYMTQRVRQLGGNDVAKKTKSRLVRWFQYGVATLVLLIGAFLIFALALPDDNGRAAKRAAIELCWQDHKNPALDESTKRFVAQTCNGMTSEYRAKYNGNP